MTCETEANRVRNFHDFTHSDPICPSFKTHIIKPQKPHLYNYFY